MEVSDETADGSIRGTALRNVFRVNVTSTDSGADDPVAGARFREP